MAVARPYAARQSGWTRRGIGDLPVAAYREAIGILKGARARARGRDEKLLHAQRILLDRLISPPGGGLGERLTQFHEYLYDQLTYAHLFKERKVLEEVFWTLQEMDEFCSLAEAG